MRRITNIGLYTLPPSFNPPFLPHLFITSFVLPSSFLLPPFFLRPRMGAEDAPLEESALDPRLRVRGGIRGLRVADQSVTPFVVSANTNASR